MKRKNELTMLTEEGKKVVYFCNKRQRKRKKEFFWVSNLNNKILKDYSPHLYDETTLMDGTLRNLV